MQTNGVESCNLLDQKIKQWFFEKITDVWIFCRSVNSRDYDLTIRITKMWIWFVLRLNVVNIEVMA